MPILGIHLIWTCYMTWPPGDPRGHWSPLFDFYGHILKCGKKLNPPDSTTYRRAEIVAKEPPKILTPVEIETVAAVIGQLSGYIAPGMPGVTTHTRDDPRHAGGYIPGLTIHAAAIEPTHVHLLIAPVQQPLDKVVGQLKSRSSSAVLTLTGNESRSRTWTAGYWKVFLDHPESLMAVSDYIEQHNLRRGLPRTPYPWIQPL